MAGLEAAVSVLVGVVVKKAGSYGLEFLGARSALRNAVSKLERKLRAIKDVLTKKAKQEPGWLRDLKDAVYEAEAVLDEIEYERLKRQVKKLNLPSIFFEHSVLSRVREIEAKLGDILSTASTVEALSHQNQTVHNSSSTRETSARSDTEQLFGRGDERGHIVQWLLKEPLDSSEGSSMSVHINAVKDIPVLPIYGLGGMGKSTLAQHIFNDVKSDFDLSVWVYVSENFDRKKIMNDIVRSVQYKIHQSGNFLELETSKNKLSIEFSDSIDLCEQKLINALAGKKFLIVLDDVWNEDKDNWDRLRNCFKCGDLRSKIMVTCRSEKIAKLTATSGVEPIHLEGLKLKHLWSLLKNHVFGEQSTSSQNSDSEEFERIGLEIAEKLQGSPLAAKTIGPILKSNLVVTYWTDILESELWEIEQNESGIMPALLLSYQYLPDYLKPFFTFLSFLPKGALTWKRNHILRCIAHGFVQTDDNKKSLISVGMEYINELLSRSLLEEKIDMDGEWIFMHDLIHDMTTMVSRDDIFVIKDNNYTQIPKGVRHLTIYCDGYQIDWMKITSQVDIKRLHSLLIDGWDDTSIHSENKDFILFIEKVLSKGKILKLLELDFVRLKSIPSSIGNLKQLRHLDLFGNLITALPKSLTTLYHLQSLVLTSCDKLEILPKQMKNLINLCHFVGDHSQLDIACLQRLRSVERLTFKILRTKEHTLKELGALNDVHFLIIERLENVSSKEEAMEAKLKDKKYLEIIRMEWSSEVSPSNRTSNDEEVLEGLQPSSQLIKLMILNYKGARCPSWMSGHDLPNLLLIALFDCYQLSEISTSKNLQESIQEIWLENCRQLQGGPLMLENNIFFPQHLKILCIRLCGEFGNSLQWTHLAHLKFLKQLILRGCTCIEYLPTKALQSLEILEVDDCKMLSIKEGMGGLEALASLVRLRIYKCDKLLADLVNKADGTVLPSSLKDMYIGNFPHESFFQVSVRLLHLSNSKKLQSLPTMVFFTVEHLRIIACPNLYPPKTTGEYLHSLKECPLKHFCVWDTSLACVKEWLLFLKYSQLNELNIVDIPELQSCDLDGMLADLPALRDLRLKYLPNMHSLPSKLHEHPSLRFVKIKKCPNVKSLSGSMFAPSTVLKIVDCPQLLKRLPKKQFVELGKSRYLVKSATTTAA